MPHRSSLVIAPLVPSLFWSENCTTSSPGLVGFGVSPWLVHLPRSFISSQVLVLLGPFMYDISSVSFVVPHPHLVTAAVRVSVYCELNPNDFLGRSCFYSHKVSALQPSRILNAACGSSL